MSQSVTSNLTAVVARWACTLSDAPRAADDVGLGPHARDMATTCIFEEACHILRPMCGGTPGHGVLVLS